MDAKRCIAGVVESLKSLGYNGCLFEEDALEKSLSKGISSDDLMNLFVSVCDELKSLCSLAETVHKPVGPDDEETLILELRSIMRELGCWREDLSNPSILKTSEGLLNCLEYLLGELLAARLQVATSSEEGGSSHLPEDPVGRNLALMVKAYGLSVPPPTVGTKQIMQRMIAKVKESLSKMSEPSRKAAESAMLDHPLSVEQWSEVDRINHALCQEYKLRREMMLKRADVTVQSFAWSNKVEGKEERYSQVHRKHEKSLLPSVPVSISQVLVARQDLTVVRPSSSEAALRCDINKVMIGKVPDRGGRPLETRPPPEMPSFKARVEPPKEKRDGVFLGKTHLLTLQ
jgi:hypothetical protein